MGRDSDPAQPDYYPSNSIALVLLYNGGMEGLGVSSRAYFLWNNSWGRAVTDAAGTEVSLEADTERPVASLTKIMTAYVVLELRNLDEEVVITEEMLGGLEEFAVAGLRAGQQTTVEELLYALMLPSAGDAAQALALSTSGSIEEFVRLMNREAANLGMTHTQFSNPVGFDAGVRSGDHEGAQNYSTARDIAKLLRVALQNGRFRTIFESFEKELPRLGMTVRKTFSEVEYMKGGKSGYTNAAGRALASTAEIEGVEYILVTLGAPAFEASGAVAHEHLRDAERIYQMVEDEYGPVRLVTKGEELVRIPVEGSPVKELTWRAGSDFVAALPTDFPLEELTYDYVGVEKIQRGVSERVLGHYRVLHGEEELYSKEIYLFQECEGIENCVGVPKFYNYYGWLGLGLLVTAVLAGAAVWAFWAFRRTGRARAARSAVASGGARKGSFRRWLPWMLTAATVLNLVLLWLIFEVWYPVQEGPEVHWSGATRLDVDEEEAGGSAESGEEGEASAGEAGESQSVAAATSGNCTVGLGNLMLINPNFTVDSGFIAGRRGQLVSISQLYGIQEYHPAGNGDNLMMPEAAAHLNEMLAAYRAAYPGHEMGTYSCFRAVGTSCGRLCAATGASDHHTGLTCDLIDRAYGERLNTDFYNDHVEWQWLRANSYKYGFIDRFPAAWAGGSMNEPLNVDASGSTGLFETWHYRYVGVTAATEIATGKYNGGAYDSLEHYLKATGRVSDLKAGKCQ